MEKGEKFQREKIEIGKLGYLNENCWLAKNLNYAPYKRCQYCELKFRNCLFLHYQIVSLILILFFLTLSFLIEGENSKLVIISVFTLVIVYGYFFNRCTEKIIKANFAQRKAKEALEELAEGLEDQVEQRTKDLRKANIQLKKLDKAKSEFLDIASHQLRTPVSVIKGVASMMKEGDFDKMAEDKRKDLIQGIWEKSRKLEEIINDILNASEMTNVGYSVAGQKAELLDVAQLAKDITDGLQPAAQEKGVELKFTVLREILPKIFCEKEYLEEAISNLIDNAIKYTPSVKAGAQGKSKEKGLVSVSLKKDAQSVIIEIKDNGIGIPPQELPGLFKKFQRASNARNMYTDGSGLGLFISKEIIEGHGGKINLESELDQGTTFYVSLPIHQPGETDIKKYIIDKQTEKEE